MEPRERCGRRWDRHGFRHAGVGALVAASSLLSACSGECTEASPCWRSFVGPWGDLPVTSLCVQVVETWYEPPGFDLTDIDDRAEFARRIEEERAALGLGEEWPATYDEPFFREDLEGALTGSDLTVVASDCDATLTADATGVPLRGDYEVLIEGNRTGIHRRLFDHALVFVTMRLEAPGRDPLVGDASGWARKERLASTATTEPNDIDFASGVDLPLWDWVDQRAEY